MKHEIELKYGLRSKKDFDRLFNLLASKKCGPISLLTQENYFFDTQKKALKKKRMTFRLRQQNSSYILTVKKSLSSQEEKSNLSSRIEFECEIERSSAENLLRGTLTPIDFFAELAPDCPADIATHRTLLTEIGTIDAHDLRLIGSFKNTRHEIPIRLLDRTFILELDHAVFPQDIDIFELEAEFASTEEANTIKPLLEQILTEHNIATDRSPSKSSRLYKILF